MAAVLQFVSIMLEQTFLQHFLAYYCAWNDSLCPSSRSDLGALQRYKG